MTTEKLKENLIKSIRATDNQFILENLQRLLDFELDNEIYITNEAQRAAIEQGLRDIENGRVFTNEQVNEQTNKWLEE